jgi:hypothetical protein
MLIRMQNRTCRQPLMARFHIGKNGTYQYKSTSYLQIGSSVLLYFTANICVVFSLIWTDGRMASWNDSFSCASFYFTVFILVCFILINGTITYKPRRQQRRQRAQAHNSTPYRHQQSFMYWLCSKQKALLCPC